MKKDIHPNYRPVVCQHVATGAGVTVHSGEFKRTKKGFEEEETEVVIGVAPLEVFHHNDADCVFIISGNTDIMPALRAARRMYSGYQTG